MSILTALSERLAAALQINSLLEKVNKGLEHQRALAEKIADIEGALTNLPTRSFGPDKGTQILLTQMYRRLAAEGTVLPFEEVEFRNFSQFGEDGILHYVFSLIGTLNRTSVEICAGEGVECNTANLIINHGWNALLVDGDKKKVEHGRNFYRNHPDTQYGTPKFLHRWVSKQSINQIIEEAGFSGEIDLLSLDMDGVDYWIWEACTSISPRVVVLEANVHMGSEPLTVPYSENFRTQWIRLDPTTGINQGSLTNWTMYGGASVAAFNKLAKSKGYRLIGTNSIGFNLLFMRNDVGSQFFPEVSEQDCFKEACLEQIERGSKVLLQQELVRV